MVKKSLRKADSFGSKFRKIPLAFFAAFGLLYSFLIIYFVSNHSSVPMMNNILCVVLGGINLTLLGYSLRLKKAGARRFVFFGTLLITIGFTIFYPMDAFYGNPAIFVLLGTIVDIFTTFGYIYMLFGMGRAVK